MNGWRTGKLNRARSQALTSSMRQSRSFSASNDLATDWGKAVRNIIASDEFRLVYPGVELAEDSRAAGKWQTKQGGIYVAASVGTSILGRGADEYLIDDPFGTMADARSEVMRENVWDWFNGTVYNRLQPGGAIILIAHRMHEDDLAGRLIERMKAGADTWTIVRLPAIAEATSEEYPEPDPLGRKVGEALWPASYPVAALDRIRANTLARNWSALYQQRPTPDEGEMFVPDRMSLRRTTEDVFVWVRAWDLAGSKDGDWTCGVLMGKSKSGKIVIGNVVRMRVRPNEVANRVLATAEADTSRIKIDPKQAGIAQQEFYVQLLQGFTLDFSPESGDKQTRAEPFRGAGEQLNACLTSLAADQRREGRAGSAGPR